MPDDKILELIREDFQTVTKSVNTMTGQLGGVEKTLVSVNDTLNEHRDDIKDLRRDQLNCSARSGWKGLGREMGEVKDTQKDDRDWMDKELRELRGETTGQFDVPPVALPAPVEPVRTNGAIIGGFFKSFGPWIMLALIGLGVSIGNGGDMKETLKVLNQFATQLTEIAGKVEQIEKMEAIPMLVPAPVSSEMVLP